MSLTYTSIVPGSVDLSSYNKDIGETLVPLEVHRERKIILLATSVVNEATVFLNGLGQNIIIFYDLFESLGYECYLVQYNGADKQMLDKYNVITPNDILRNNMRVHLYIEIGMSLDAPTRAYLRSIGARIVKLYLGNILNIDIESVQSFKNVFFNHHLTGEVDDIWMSPHYLQNLEYGLSINRVPLSKGAIAPYVWDPLFIQNGVNPVDIKWRAPTDWKKTDIIIMDPNISFQKASFYSLLLVDAFSKKCPEWMGNVLVINGDRLKLQANMSGFVLPSLDLYKKGRVSLLGRMGIQDILKKHQSATFITCQWTNPFNYMTLELMFNDFPVLHNSDGWEAFGYAYSVNKWDAAISVLEKAIRHHSELLSVYRSHSAQLIWKHSIHNPDIRREWRRLLSGN